MQYILICMRDTLPNKLLNIECGILNLDLNEKRSSLDILV